ncbi:MAG: hypothetical protein KF865_11200 [Bdellovibrionaceae bacterium]|nr:hypothetical protein [Pseudobdellovibrionaceae bacterium]
MASSQHISAIDIGSNAIRMIVGEIHDQRLHTVQKFRAPVRLGKDVFKHGRISEEVLHEAEETFRRFAEINRKYRVRGCRAVATSAVREAANRRQFTQRILKTSGIGIEVIDGIEEARLIHTAVQREVDLSRKRLLLIDVGGGSVEITFSENGMMSATQSFPMGTVRILQMLQKRKLPEKGLKVVMGEFIQPLSRYLESHVGHAPVELAVGTGGNLECMGRLKTEMLGRTPATLVSLQELTEISERLEALTVNERIDELNLRPDRADVIVPAVLLVKTVLRQAGVEKLLIPGVGLRDGLLWSVADHLPASRA